MLDKTALIRPPPQPSSRIASARLAAACLRTQRCCTRAWFQSSRSRGLGITWKKGLCPETRLPGGTSPRHCSGGLGGAGQCSGWPRARARLRRGLGSVGRGGGVGSPLVFLSNFCAEHGDVGLNLLILYIWLFIAPQDCNGLHHLCVCVCACVRVSLCCVYIGRGKL